MADFKRKVVHFFAEPIRHICRNVYQNEIKKDMTSCVENILHERRYVNV